MDLLNSNFKFYVFSYCVLSMIVLFLVREMLVKFKINISVYYRVILVIGFGNINDFILGIKCYKFDNVFILRLKKFFFKF